MFYQATDKADACFELLLFTWKLYTMQPISMQMNI